jgi:hypothetical protein
MRSHRVSLGIYIWDHQDRSYTCTWLYKSFYPDADVGPLGEGVAADCSYEKLFEYLQEVTSVAEKIVDSMELE